MMPRFTLRACAHIVLAALAAACSPLAAVNVLVPEDGYRQQSGLAYGPDPRHQLDLYLPATPDPSATVVVFLYGGAWRNGARANYAFAGAAFAARGYLTVVPDYRLYPQVQFPAFVEDAARAVAWVRREIGNHGGDPGRIVLVGHSAGAHSAALLALDRRYLADAGVPEVAILGVIGLAGPYGFDPTTYRTTREIFASAARADDTRPLAFARAGAPPMLLIHGAEDSTVEPRNSATLAQALRDKGVAARYLPLDEVGHAGVLLALAAPFEGLAPVVPEALAFIRGLGPRQAGAETSSARAYPESPPSRPGS